MAEEVKKANPEATQVTVDDKGNVTLTYKDGSTNVIPADKTVTENELTDADKNPAKDPTKTVVENKDKLTEEEKSKVKEEVKKANPNAKDITVDDKGNVTITYPDNSTNTLTPDRTIVEKSESDAEKVQPNIPEKTKVEDPKHLTKDEKDKVKEAIEKANKDKFPRGTKVEVGEDGTVTITYPDGSTDTIKGSDVVVKKPYNPGTTPGGTTDPTDPTDPTKPGDNQKPGDGDKPGSDQKPGDNEKPSDMTIADKVDPAVPGKIKVKDPSNLTDDEKSKVKEAIEKANKDKFPQGTKVEIGKDGSATITYPDGSKDTIKGSNLVEKIADAPTRPSKPSKQDKPAKNLPKAGIDSEAMMMAAAALSTLGGLYVSKKKKEDKE